MNELIRQQGSLTILDEDIQEQLIMLETRMKALKARSDELRAYILDEMEQKNIIKIETPELLISYIAATDRETFDSKTLREECPDIYDAYVKISRVKPSVRVKLR